MQPVSPLRLFSARQALFPLVYFPSFSFFAHGTFEFPLTAVYGPLMHELPVGVTLGIMNSILTLLAAISENPIIG